ncbi:Guanylate-binding protein 1 [Coccomyxa sp. Obi]|nr:Guanylate-binding protein 1 [Coccomyxa sp. Obi]
MSFFWGSKKQKAVEPSTSTVAKPGAPLELVRYSTDTGKFEVPDEALEVLRNINGPVGVVSVCGRARQGKSFILNQLLGQSSGFTVGPTHRPCTKGLWMWSTPVERQAPDGSKYHLVLLDTEGIDAYDQTGQYSTQIFSLAVLLSSLFVYNQMGGIDEAALDRLSLVTEMTKHIRVRAGSAAGENEAELSNFTPSFLWLLRDFYLTLEEEGRTITPKQYLETALQPIKGQGRSVEAKNAIRESIKALFPDRDCFALKRPMSDEDQLSRLETVPPSQLRPEFREGLARLTQLIFARAQPKRLGPQIISGPMLAGLASAYVEAINKGAVPTISTAWQGVAEAESRRAADAAEQAYREEFNRDVSADEGQLDAEHLRALAAAQEVFNDKAVGEASVRMANAKRFHDRCQREFEAFRKERLASGELECQKLINAAQAHLTQVASQPDATVEKLQSELLRWEEQYQASTAAAGPAKWRLRSAFLSGTYASLLRSVEERRAAEERARASEVNRHNRELEARAAAARQAAEEAEQKRLHVEQQLHSFKPQEAEWRKREASLIAAEQQQRQRADRLQAEKDAQQQHIDKLERQLQEAVVAHTEAAAATPCMLTAERDAAIAARDKALADAAAKDAAVAAANEARTAAEAEATQLRSRPAAPLQEAVPMEADGAFEDAEEGVEGIQGVQPEKMSIIQLKNWLTEQGHEDQVWKLAQSKAKKPQYVAAARAVLGA